MNSYDVSPSDDAGPTDVLRHCWIDWLEADSGPRGAWAVAKRPPDPRGWNSYDLELNSLGSKLTGPLLKRRSAASSPVVVMPFYGVEPLVGEPCSRTAGRVGPSQAYALEVVKKGIAALAVPWWCEAAVEPTAPRHLMGRYGALAAEHHRSHSTTPLGSSIDDLKLAVDALVGLDGIDHSRIGAFGHSLGGKLVMHLAALDPRIAPAAVHEPGVGFDHSNWDAPWYLGQHRPSDRNQDELLGLTAPRAFRLLSGGQADGAYNASIALRPSRRCPQTGALESWRHAGGHSLLDEVLTRRIDWLATELMKADSM